MNAVLARWWRVADATATASFGIAVQLAFLLEAFAVKREYNLKVVKIREVRKACGDGAAERMQAEELDEAWYVWHCAGTALILRRLTGVVADPVWCAAVG